MKRWKTVLTYITLLAMLAFVVNIVVSFRRSRNYLNLHSCEEYQRCMDGVKEQLAFKGGLTRLTEGQAVSWSDLDASMKGGFPRQCPAGGQLSPGVIGEAPSCSIHGSYTTWQYGLAPYYRGHFVHIVKGDQIGASRVSPTELLHKWLAVVNADAECHIEERHAVKNQVTGEVCGLVSPGNTVWTNPRTGQRVYLDFYGHGISSREPDADTINKMKALAGKLGAKVIGSDNKVY